MSRNLSASGDGDAASNNRKTNCRSGSSSRNSFKGRTGLEGPYGDSPTERQRHYQEEYIILMINDNAESRPTSQNNQELELYNLRSDYIQNLNIVRRRLNLAEITDDSVNSTYRSACKITEITDEAPEGALNELNVEKYDSNDADRHVNRPMFPFKNFTDSDPRFLEIEYTPPKKKTCHRQKTPQLSLMSKEQQRPSHSLHLLGGSVNRFTKNVETQCSFETFFTSHPLPKEKTDVPLILSNSESYEDEVEICTKNLFPEVIIKNHSNKNLHFSTNSDSEILSNEENVSEVKEENYPQEHCFIESTEVYHRITSPPKCISQSNNCSLICDRSNHPLNFIDDTSEDNYNTGTTSTTTILESRSSEEKKNRIFRNAYNQCSVWEELKKTQTVKLHEGCKHDDYQYLNKQKVIKPRLIQNRSNVVKSLPKSRKKTEKMKIVPYASRALIDDPTSCCLEHKYFYFSSDTDFHSSVFDSNESPRECKSSRSCWDGLVQWFLNIFRKRI